MSEFLTGKEIVRLLKEAHYFASDDFPEVPPETLTPADVVATDRYLLYWKDLSRALGEIDKLNGFIAVATSETEVAEDGEARKAYEDYCESTGIHSNRLPGWSELSKREQSKWVKKNRRVSHG